MLRQTISCVVLACVLLLAGCHHKVQNPMANIDSKQPDKGLFDRAMESMKKAHYQEARTLLETLINAYPQSEYIARAKLAVGDSWYAEGGSVAFPHHAGSSRSTIEGCQNPLPADGEAGP